MNDDRVGRLGSRSGDLLLGERFMVNVFLLMKG